MTPGLLVQGQRFFLDGNPRQHLEVIFPLLGEHDKAAIRELRDEGRRLLPAAADRGTGDQPQPSGEETSCDPQGCRPAGRSPLILINNAKIDELIYTALTRAQRRVIFPGDRFALRDAASSAPTVCCRKTGFSRWLRVATRRV